MRLLFVGEAFDVHTARWISQLEDTGWEIHLFDPLNRLVHEELRGVRLHTGWKKSFVPEGTRVRYRWPFARGRHFLERRLPALWKRVLPPAEQRLARLLRRLEPDAVHSMGLWHYGETVLRARELLGGTLPAPWIYSSRGSDLFYHRQFPEHEALIRELLAACDYYFCECRRDVRLAADHGFRGGFLGLVQGNGGFPIQRMRTLRPPGRTAARRRISVKGLQTRYGDALTAVEALRRASKALDGYSLSFYQAHPATREAARRLEDVTRCPVEILPYSSAERMWRLFGESRVSIGVSRSDGVPNTMLEAMILGAFPIQTDPGGASAEWIEDGVNGLLVPHDDPDAVAAAITRALSDDALVDAAASRNLELVRERVDAERLRPRIVEAYRRVTGER